MSTINIAAVQNALQGTFTENYSAAPAVVGQLILSRGAMPISPSVAISAADNITSGTVAIAHSLFTSPADGSIQLLSPLTIPIKTSVVDAVPTFIRLQTTVPVGIIDIPVSDTPGLDNAVISNVLISTGQSVQITSLSVNLAGFNDLVISKSYLDGILRLMFGFPTAAGHNNRLMGTWSKVINSSTSAEVNAVLAIEAYDGAVPLTDDETPAGTLLWKRTIPTAELPAVLSVINNSIYSNRVHQANALATGIPTFIRIVKNAITSGTGVYPRLCIQLTIEKHVGFAQTEMVTGVSNTLSQFNLSMLP